MIGPAGNAQNAQEADLIDRWMEVPVNAVKRTILETMVLLVVGATVAFAGNALRSKNSIELAHNYFEIKRVAVPNQAETPPEVTKEIAGSSAVAAAAPAPEVEKHLEHDYQSISLQDVKTAFHDPTREQGLIVFVDARADEPFSTGHIPGALQCDHYNLSQYIDPVMAKARIAEQVIVYCNGGQCEDSIFMCQNLLEGGLDYKAVFLFEGGWKEWEKSGMPIAKGKEE